MSSIIRDNTESMSAISVIPAVGAGCCRVSVGGVGAGAVNDDGAGVGVGASVPCCSGVVAPGDVIGSGGPGSGVLGSIMIYSLEVDQLFLDYLILIGF